MPETALKNHKPGHTAEKSTLGLKHTKSATIYSVEKSHEESQLRKVRQYLLQCSTQCNRLLGETHWRKARTGLSPSAQHILSGHFIQPINCQQRPWHFWMSNSLPAVEATAVAN